MASSLAREHLELVTKQEDRAPPTTTTEGNEQNTEERKQQLDHLKQKFEKASILFVRLLGRC